MISLGTIERGMLESLRRTPEANAVQTGQVTRKQAVTLGRRLGLDWARAAWKQWRRLFTEPRRTARTAPMLPSVLRHVQGYGDRSSGETADPARARAQIHGLSKGRPPRPGGAASLVRVCDRITREIIRRRGGDCNPVEVLRASAVLVEGVQTSDHSDRCTRVYDDQDRLLGDYIDDGWQSEQAAARWIDTAIALAPEPKRGGPWD